MSSCRATNANPCHVVFSAKMARELAMQLLDAAQELDDLIERGGDR